MIGDSGVGKSCIISRYIYNTYNPYINTTIGAQFMTRDVDNKYRIDIWDTAGQERFRSLIPLYTRGANIICFVVSLDTEPTEIEKQKQFWLDYIKQNTTIDQNCKNIIIYNKLDLNREFKLIEDERFDHNIVISCKTGEGLDKLTKIIDNIVYTLEPSLNKQAEQSNINLGYTQYLLNYLPNKESISTMKCNIL